MQTRLKAWFTLVADGRRSIVFFSNRQNILHTNDHRQWTSAILTTSVNQSSSVATTMAKAKTNNRLLRSGSTGMAAMGHPKYTVAGLIFAAIVLFIIGFLIGFFTAPSDDKACATQSISEKRKAEEKAKKQFHGKLYETLNAAEIRKNLEYFSARPHVGGTKRSKDLADEIGKRWREYGFDKVEQPKYNILLPKVNPNVSNSVKILNEDSSVALEFTGKEKLADPSEDDPLMIAPLLGYAKQGAADGTLLYANYGTQEDFNTLSTKFNITDCKGKIVIMKYGRIFRGSKVKFAEDCGAAGAILYNDPKDYAPDGPNKTYPDYIWLPKTGVQRGTILRGEGGDPLTPGLPSIEGVSRIPMDQAILPKIPATPLPYGDAVELLKLMQGTDVPDTWKGTLPITYKLGDGGLKANKTIRIQVNVPTTRQDIYNVIGTIYGKEEPDRWVLIGNHRDAWGFGAVDASSGTAAMMEISRGLKGLLASGWRPRRTIKFCSWGAEESGLHGSTEWVEENERHLTTKGVTYINVDIAVDMNETYRANGSPLLKTILFDDSKLVDDPHEKNGTNMTVYERMVEKGSDGKSPKYGGLGSGSDYAAFYQYIGVPSLDMSYHGKVFYPVYHTVHDTFKWMLLVDPKFVFHLTTTRMAARLLMDTADRLVLPLDVTKYAKAVNESLNTLKAKHGATLQANNITLEYIEKAIDAFKKETTTFAKERDATDESKSELQVRNLNDRMVNVEKAFIYPLGLPGRRTVRHILFAPSISDSYGTTSFPGISDLLSPLNSTAPIDWETVKEQVSIAYLSIRQAVEVLKADAK